MRPSVLERISTSTLGLKRPSYSATASRQKAETSAVQICTALSCSRFSATAVGATARYTAGSDGAAPSPSCRDSIRLHRIESARLAPAYDWKALRNAAGSAHSA